MIKYQKLKKYKLNINVVVDHHYTSQNKYVRTVNMQLKDSHYTLRKNKSIELIHTINKTEQKLSVFKSDYKIVKYYDGKEYGEIPHDKYIKGRENNSKYLYVPSKTQLKEDYDNYVTLAQKNERNIKWKYKFIMK